MIAAANSEAFPVSPPSSTSYISPATLQTQKSPGSSSPVAAHGSLSHTASAFPLTSDRVFFGEGKEAEGRHGLSSLGEEKSPAQRRKSITHESKESDAKPRIQLETSGSLSSSLNGITSVIPQFYVPGEGGRGRGRKIESDTLEERLTAIVDLFRKSNSVNAPIPQPPDSKGKTSVTRSRSSSSPTTVEVCGVSISWEDAHLGLAVESFAAVAKTLCGFPSFFAAPLFRRIRSQFVPSHFLQNGVATTPAVGFTGVLGNLFPSNTENQNSVVKLSIAETKPNLDDSMDRDTTGVIPLPLFMAFWRKEIEPYDPVDRFFRLLKRRSARAIEAVDFMPYMEELLAFHPGLAFLESTPEFQEKYARTVIARIFYVLDPSCRKCIDSRQLRNSRLMDAFHSVDVEEDINVVNDFFR
jgi:serine/threonine-protein phosphatase 2A regulatory subunit B''